LQKKMSLILITLLLVTSCCAVSGPKATSESNLHRHYEKLFSTDFCDSSVDIRVVLLGQAWIRYPNSNLSYPGVDTLISFLQSLKATVILANFEEAVNGTYAQEHNATILNPIGTHIAPPEVIDVLSKNLGINMLSTSNNHNSDLGPAGTISTILEFQTRNQLFTGSGYNATQALTPATIKHSNGKTIGFLGVVSSALLSVYGGIANATTAGVNAMQILNNNTLPDPIPHQKNVNATLQLCQKTDLVVNYHHNHIVNASNIYGLLPWWQAFAHELIDSGGSIYLSGGNENIRGIELYKGNLLVYSLGNLFFQEGKNVEALINREGLILDACYDGKTTALKAARVLPTILLNGTGTPGAPNWLLTHGVPSLPDATQGLSTLYHLQNLSAAFGTIITIDTVNVIGYINLTQQVSPDGSLKCKRTQDLSSDHQSDAFHRFALNSQLLAIMLLLAFYVLS